MDSGVLERAKGLLAQLVAFDTVSDKSNLPLIAFVEAYLQDLGVATRRVPNARGDKAALLATIGPEVDGGVVKLLGDVALDRTNSASLSHQSCRAKRASSSLSDGRTAPAGMIS